MERYASGISLTVDGVILLLLLCCAILKGGKGLYRSLVPLGVTVLSAVCAAILTAAFTERAVALLFPWAREQLFSRVDFSSIRSLNADDIVSQLERLMPEMLTGLARDCGVPIRTAVEQAMENASGSAARAVEDAVDALLLPAVTAAARYLLFFALFALLKLVLSVAARALRLGLAPAPLRRLDALGGALLGLAECAVVLWLLVRLGAFLNSEPLSFLLEHSRVLSLFL